MKVIARQTTVEHFNAPDLNDPVPFQWIDTGGFGIEDNLTFCHEESFFSAFCVRVYAVVNAGKP